MLGELMSPNGMRANRKNAVVRNKCRLIAVMFVDQDLPVTGLQSKVLNIFASDNVSIQLSICKIVNTSFKVMEFSLR